MICSGRFAEAAATSASSPNSNSPVHPAGTVLGGVVLHPFAGARGALRTVARLREDDTRGVFGGRVPSCTSRRILCA